MEERLNVIIGAKTDGFRRGLQDSQNSLNGFQRNVAKIGGLIAASFGAYQLLEFGKAVIKISSDVEETASKFDAVFKGLKDSTREWANQTASDMKRSRFDLEKYLAILQDTFVPLGFTRGEAAEFSKTLTKLTIDVASFQNAAEDDVLRDFQSAIVGNHETVRKYGIVITQASLDQELFNMGISKGAAKANELEKAQARLNIIIKGTSDAHGDAVRTGDSYANTIKDLAAAWDELKVSLGSGVLPLLAEAAKRLAFLIREGGVVGVVIPWYAEYQHGKDAQAGTDYKNIKKMVNTAAEYSGVDKRTYLEGNLDTPDAYLRGLGPIDQVRKAVKELLDGMETAGDEAKEVVKNVTPSILELQTKIKANNKLIKEATDYNEAARLVKENAALAEKIKNLEILIGLRREELKGAVDTMSIIKSKGVSAGQWTTEDGESSYSGNKVLAGGYQSYDFGLMKAVLPELRSLSTLDNDLNNIGIKLSDLGQVGVSAFQAIGSSVGMLGAQLTNTGEMIFSLVWKILSALMIAGITGGAGGFAGNIAGMFIPSSPGGGMAFSPGPLGGGTGGGLNINLTGELTAHGESLKYIIDKANTNYNRNS